MAVRERSSIHGADTQFLDPAILSRINGLDLLARTVVDGFLQGIHRSPHLGMSLDFAEHREYIPGDDIRRIGDGVRELAAADMIPGGTLDNFEHVSPHMDWSDGLSRTRRLILADAQTSGGLLLAISEEDSTKLIERLHGGGDERAAVIGRVTGEGAGRIRVL